MSKRIYLEALFNQFDSFLEQVCRVFPDELDFKVYRNGLAFMRKTNPTYVMQEFAVHVSPFERVIMEKDEKFFLEYPFNEFEDGSEDSVAKVIHKIKGLWTTMSAGNKDVVMEYIKTLVLIQKRYAAVS